MLSFCFNYNCFNYNCLGNQLCMSLERHIATAYKPNWKHVIIVPFLWGLNKTARENLKIEKFLNLTKFMKTRSINAKKSLWKWNNSKEDCIIFDSRKNATAPFAETTLKSCRKMIYFVKTSNYNTFLKRIFGSLSHNNHKPST